jgi:hypothetical protein
MSNGVAPRPHSTSIPSLAATPPSYRPAPAARTPHNTSAPVEWILLFLAIVALGFAAWLWSSWGGPRLAVSSSDIPKRDASRS